MIRHPYELFNRLDLEQLEVIDRLALGFIEGQEQDQEFTLPNGQTVRAVDIVGNGVEASNRLIYMLFHAAKHAGVDPAQLVAGYCMAMACEMNAEGDLVGPEGITVEYVIMSTLACLRIEQMQNPEIALAVAMGEYDEGDGEEHV